MSISGNISQNLSSDTIHCNIGKTPKQACYACAHMQCAPQSTSIKIGQVHKQALEKLSKDHY